MPPSDTEGYGSKSGGYFVEPTVIVTTDPKYDCVLAFSIFSWHLQLLYSALTMREEIFGPVLTVCTRMKNSCRRIVTWTQVYTYDESKFEETLSLCDSTSPYALTGQY